MRRSIDRRPGSFRATVALGALLVAAAPAAAQFGPQYDGRGFGKNKIQYRDFKWEIYNSPHFNVYYYPETEPLLEKVVSLAESAYDRLSREFDFQIQDPVPLIYYATHSAFEQNNIILNFIPEGVGAFATPARFRMVLPVDMPDPELYALILHELTHIFQYHMLFQGSLAKAVATVPPTWFMEGMASYMAKDESARDKMFLRDAVVNDRIPSIRQNFGGFFAYRFGHAFFDFIEERWGKEGFLDYIYEIRNTIGSRADRAIERAFRMEPEEFDQEFRRWLRKKYLPELLETGEPADFGRLFRIEEGVSSQEISPTASPSGDLVAAFSSYAGDVDVVLFDTENRTFVRNLTKGYSNEYQYLVAQEFTLGREMGRDLSFSPDGNTIAVFAKREKGRSLVLLDVLRGGIRRVVDIDAVEQQHSPTWSADGRKVAFSGWRDGKFDIFTIDLETGELANVTNDDVFDGAPAYSPDGRSIAFVSVVGDGFAKLFRVDLADPSKRYQITGGDSNENDPVYSPDGQRLYFTSDRQGAENIFGLDLATGEIRQYTNVVTGTFMPTVLRTTEGAATGVTERLVYTGFWKGRFDLYAADIEEPVTQPMVIPVAAEPTLATELPRFEPDIQVAIDDANKDKYGGFRFFLEDAQSYVGVDDNQTYVGRIFLTFSDYLGDRRIFANLSSIDSFSNFDILYADLSDRLQWQVRAFDSRSFFIGQDVVTGELRRGRATSKVTGAVGSLVYPFTFYQRAELGVGYVFREFLAQDFTGGVPSLVEVKDDFPILQGALVGDSTIFAPWGPIGGRRWRLDASYSPDLDESGTLQSSIDLDVRQYIPVTQRSGLALRGFAGYSDGNRILPYALGGIDTVRGFEYRELVGDRAFFANVEYRFPLIDLLATPVLAFQSIRGIFFLDVGGAWFDGDQEFDFYNSDESRLEDAVSAYGFGLSLRLLGLDVNWDFAKRWDFDQGEDGFRTSFWIGSRF